MKIGGERREVVVPYIIELWGVEQGEIENVYNRVLLFCFVRLTHHCYTHTVDLFCETQITTLLVCFLRLTKATPIFCWIVLLDFITPWATLFFCFGRLT